jgi:hypothetical protein
VEARRREEGKGSAMRRVLALVAVAGIAIGLVFVLRARKRAYIAVQVELLAWQQTGPSVMALVDGRYEDCTREYAGVLDEVVRAREGRSARLASKPWHPVGVG